METDTEIMFPLEQIIGKMKRLNEASVKLKLQTVKTLFTVTNKLKVDIYLQYVDFFVFIYTDNSVVWVFLKELYLI